MRLSMLVVMAVRTSCALCRAVVWGGTAVTPAQEERAVPEILRVPAESRGLDKALPVRARAARATMGPQGTLGRPEVDWGFSGRPATRRRPPQLMDRSARPARVVVGVAVPTSARPAPLARVAAGVELAAAAELVDAVEAVAVQASPWQS